jgi:predicted MFS family arabinose efflux permease
MAWEAASDEAGFVIAPVIVSLLLTAISPHAALVGLALAGFLLHLGFVRLIPLGVTSGEGIRRGASLTTVFNVRAGRRPALRAAAALLVVTGVGLVFGATQATVNALFSALDVPSMVGVAYGLVGVGSIVGGVVWAQTPDRRRGTWVVLVAGAALAVAGALAMGGPSMGVGATTILCAFVGIWLAPVLAEAYSQARTAVSSSFEVTMMTVLASGTSVGVGVGAPLASSLSSEWGSQAGFAGLVVAGTALLAGGGCIVLSPAKHARRNGTSEADELDD